jgi:hypothetical protein
MMRLVFGLISAAVLLAPHAALGQPTPAKLPRRQFVTVSIERSRTMPLHFKEFPLQQLAGRELGVDRETGHDYRSADNATSVDVQKFARATRAIGISVYPFGNRNDSTLLLKVSVETLPIIRFTINGTGSIEQYSLSDGRATDLGIGVISSDRPAGWGLGAHSFIVGGVGRVRGERGSGARLFGEAGGGINVGPIGFEVGIKIAYNRLTDPRAHSFYTIPMSLRGTVSF